MSVDTVVANVIASYEAKAAEIGQEHAEVILGLVRDIEAAGGVDSMSRYFQESLDELRIELGGQAAKALGTAAEQNAAYLRIGAWVSEILANGSTKDLVVCDIHYQGIEETAFLVPEEIVAISGKPKAP